MAVCQLSPSPPPHTHTQRSIWHAGDTQGVTVQPVVQEQDVACQVDKEEAETQTQRCGGVMPRGMWPPAAKV